MSRERAGLEGLDIDIPDFEPRPAPPAPARAVIEQAGKQLGFTARHAPEPKASTPQEEAPRFDARSLRRTNRTAKINIATTEETRTRFWVLAQRIGTTSGEDALAAMMDALDGVLDERGYGGETPHR